MTPQRILHLDAVATAGSALAMLVMSGTLAPLFGLGSPVLIEAIAVGLLGYAGAVAFIARRPHVSRQSLLAFALANAAWVVGSAVLLLVWWSQLAPLARVLVIGVALVVEAFAYFQFRAAGSAGRPSPALALSVRVAPSPC